MIVDESRSMKYLDKYLSVQKIKMRHATSEFYSVFCARYTVLLSLSKVYHLLTMKCECAR